MKTSEAINQLEDLKLHCESMLDENMADERSSVWSKDVQALDHAIKVLKEQDLSSCN